MGRFEDQAAKMCPHCRAMKAEDLIPLKIVMTAWPGEAGGKVLCTIDTLVCPSCIESLPNFVHRNASGESLAEMAESLRACSEEGGKP